MARVLINASASTAGGGTTYLRNVLPRLAADRRHTYIAYVPPSAGEAFEGGAASSVEVRPVKARNALARMAWEQASLSRTVRRENIDVVINTGNFALAFCSVPQLLFSRNDLYFSREYQSDLERRGHWLRTVDLRVRRALARKSIARSEYNIAPTRAFADKIVSAGGAKREFTILPFGYDASSVSRRGLAPEQQAILERGRGRKRILLVSHYNYFRNFETLIRALPFINAAAGERVQLVLTTDIRRGKNYGGYDATLASALIDRLGVRDDIAMLGAVPYDSVAALYEACDLFVFPSYAESFGHPMLEAMAAGLPVVVADLPVHREVCGAVARYFDVFDEVALADQCLVLLRDAALRETLGKQGVERARLFSWDEHVKGLIDLIDRAAGVDVRQTELNPAQESRVVNVR
jgi:glycosyltransferase involved in cell wall biosynthesis